MIRYDETINSVKSFKKYIIKTKNKSTVFKMQSQVDANNQRITRAMTQKRERGENLPKINIIKKRPKISDLIRQQVNKQIEAWEFRQMRQNRSCQNQMIDQSEAQLQMIPMIENEISREIQLERLQQKYQDEFFKIIKIYYNYWTFFFSDTTSDDESQIQFQISTPPKIPNIFEQVIPTMKEYTNFFSLNNEVSQTTKQINWSLVLKNISYIIQTQSMSQTIITAYNIFNSFNSGIMDNSQIDLSSFRCFQNQEIEIQFKQFMILKTLKFLINECKSRDVTNQFKFWDLFSNVRQFSFMFIQRSFVYYNDHLTNICENIWETVRKSWFLAKELELFLQAREQFLNLPVKSLSAYDIQRILSRAYISFADFPNIEYPGTTMYSPSLEAHILIINTYYYFNVRFLDNKNCQQMNLSQLKSSIFLSILYVMPEMLLRELTLTNTLHVNKQKFYSLQKQNPFSEYIGKEFFRWLFFKTVLQDQMPYLANSFDEIQNLLGVRNECHALQFHYQKRIKMFFQKRQIKRKRKENDNYEIRFTSQQVENDLREAKQSLTHFFSDQPEQVKQLKSTYLQEKSKNLTAKPAIIQKYSPAKLSVIKKEEAKFRHIFDSKGQQAKLNFKLSEFGVETCK